MGFPEKVLPVGEVYNFADRAAAQYILSICNLKDIPIPAWALMKQKYLE